ncbi:uncharacterized protein BXIN_0885 [Babesia sp. Xinjiang]|uniref:uncharacterized protein n=1 Tax=Babesia sp. Xinjiang TaxID=462227 RepID=UPI000A233845|nr:uncharacterized protein BXIN_0885 [Babesia sp. Xinjiang]ORM41224.1 hypothetical protein BXIN_0885 [Babesia sp. Xinjiang]
MKRYHQWRCFTSPSSFETTISGCRIRDYIKEKELTRLRFTDTSAKGEQQCLGIRHTLATLSNHITLDFDALDAVSSRISSSDEEFILSAPRYPKVSFFPDGHINTSLSKRGLYSDFIRDARECRTDEVIFTRRLHPIRAARGRIKKEIDIKKLQRELDNRLVEIIGLSTPSELVAMLRQMCLLDLSIRANHLGEVAKKLLKGVGSMATNELIETGFLLMSYMDCHSESIRLLLSGIGACVGKRSNSLACLPAVEILKLMRPVIQMQLSYPSTTWSILTNHQLLQQLVSHSGLLDTNEAAELFTLLTVSNSTVQLPESVSASRRLIAERLVDEVTNITERSMHRLLAVTNMFESEFPKLTKTLYHNSISRANSMRPTVLASAYLRMPSKSEVAQEFHNTVGRRYGEIATKVLVDLYCNFLQDGTRSTRQLRTFEWALSKKRSTLSMQDMSNILIYHSTHGRFPSRLNDVIKLRFSDLKREGATKYDEILDVVLSMSLVGLHNHVGVWDAVDLPYLVYSTPTNILVYLAYALLITGERNKGIWAILLERMLYEPKTYSHELYEVLMVAKVFGIFVDDTRTQLLNRASWVLQHTKSQHYAKVSRQRYQSTAPLDHALNLIGLQYVKCVMIDELYEAPFYIASHKIILDPLRESYLHVTTGLEVGEVHLRHSVWHKQGYRPFPLNEGSLRRFQDDVTKEWNVPALSDFICKVIKMEKYSPLRGTFCRSLMSHAI